jgi:hypothetical protein
MYIKSHFIDSTKFEEAFKEFKDIPFSFFFDCTPTFEELNINSINIYAHDEPNEYFGHHDWILKNNDSFSLILTWNNRILNKCSNSRLLIYGESWVDHNGEEVIYNNNTKKFEISFIRGKKLQSGGHLLRHQIFDRQDEITIPYRFYAETKIDTPKDVINSKIMAHQEAMFSLIVENTNHHNYFTEKISDCMIMKTIPVYWGCSNIENYYNIEGIIKIESDDDAIEKINKLTPEYYFEKKEIIEENWRLALKYRNYVQRISIILGETFKLNGLL